MRRASPHRDVLIRRFAPPLLRERGRVRVRAKRAFAIPHPTRYARHLLPEEEGEREVDLRAICTNPILLAPFGHIFCV